jgi:hypothetical protein
VETGTDLTDLGRRVRYDVALPFSRVFQRRHWKSTNELRAAGETGALWTSRAPARKRASPAEDPDPEPEPDPLYERGGTGVRDARAHPERRRSWRNSAGTPKGLAGRRHIRHERSSALFLGESLADNLLILLSSNRIFP